MDHVRSYYAATAHPAPLREPLRGDVTADVCVVGGGIAGCSTALNLAERGYRVVLLEGQRIGWGASGRSGGQALFGYASGQDKLIAQAGRETRATHVRRLGRGAGSAQVARREACDRLRPQPRPGPRRDQAAARDGAPGLARGTGARLRLPLAQLARPGRDRRAPGDRALHRRTARLAQWPPAPAQLHAGPGPRSGGCRRPDIRRQPGHADRSRRDRHA